MLFVLAVGDKVYGTLDKTDALVVMNSDGTGMETLAEGGCFDLGAYEQVLYYTNSDTNEFYMMDLITGETTTIPMSDRGFAQLQDGRIYYQDENNGRKLSSCALDGSDVQVLLDSQVTGINVTAGGIYCVNRSDGKSLYFVPLDGATAQQLADVSLDYVNTMGNELLLINAKGKIYVYDASGTVTKLLG